MKRTAAILTLALVTLLAGRADSAPASTAKRAEQTFTLRRGDICLEYDLHTGIASLSSSQVGRIARFYGAARVGGRYLTSKDYRVRMAATNGPETVVTLTASGLPTMRQRFTLRDGRSVLLRIELAGVGLRSNWMAPLVDDTPGALELARHIDVRALQVPFDNDKWARYDASPWKSGGVSYEVCAFYDNASRNGIVVGSVTHDTWKTAVAFSGSGSRLNDLRVFGGVADGGTHDVEPHGAVAGNRILSPKVLVGFYSDWRAGMEDFAAANAAEAPARKWTGGVPFGWNSWGKVQAGLNYAKAAGTSDYLARRLQPLGFNNRGATYVNLDSYWDNLSDAELKQFTTHVHSNGQKAGIYWSPFIYWGKNLSQRVEGTKYVYSDIVTRTKAGSPISMDGGMALDPTHPGTRGRIDHFIDRFKTLGFDYIKLDFLTHGALEGGSANGVHFDRSVQTGIQAYNSGMRYLLNRIGWTMFVSESIAPLFPYRYAHARRVSCDSFGGIGETEYVMNSAAYGWWMSGRLYAYNDPDHLVLEGHSAAENRSRVTSGAVAGTVFLIGDDLTKPEGQRLAETWFSNPAINAVARLGRPFRPLEGNTGSKAPDVLTLESRAAHYLAIFNFDGKDGATKRVDLARAGLLRGPYQVTDLWSGRTWRASGTTVIALDPAESTILRLEPAGRSARN
ncbi:MAG TPA: alpha-galactosidase [Armatimonadota bacterium]|jgi:hypothetical protein